MGTFLRQSIKEAEFYNETVFETISSWFSLKKTQVNTILMSSQISRMMTDIERQCFGLSFSVNVLTSQRIQIKNQVFHCERYFRVGKKRCNYIISFADDKKKKFGKILYFLKYSDKYFAVGLELENVSYALSNIKGNLNDQLKKIKESGVFNKFFVKTKVLSDTLVFIPIRNILSLCIVRVINEREYFVSELIYEHEHD
jgi:hypothetical protein